MRRATLTTVALLTLAACGPGEGHGDGDGGPDANGMSGLVFRFVAPDVGRTVNDLTVAQLHLRLRDVRALGDAAPGDARTTLDRGEIQLPAGDTPEIRFDEAPPGRYSSFELAVDRSQDGEASWTMEGMVHFGGEDWSFVIDDEEAHAVSLPLIGVNLAAGQIDTITVQIDVAVVCSGVDWPSLPTDGSQVLIEDDSAAMSSIRTNLATSFSIASE